MYEIPFDKVSAQYQEKALVQQAAADKLLALLGIGAKDNVLDVAFGPGHITHRIKGMTTGRVLGTDISAGMIAQAKAKYPAIDFRQLAADEPLRVGWPPNHFMPGRSGGMRLFSKTIQQPRHSGPG